MTSKKPDGGPAYPHLGLYAGADGNLHPTPTQFGGMTLRQWYAGQAVGEMLKWEWVEGLHYEEVAEQAFMVADAMIAHEAGESE